MMSVRSPKSWAQVVRRSEKRCRHLNARGRVDVGVFREGAQVVLQIEDNGPGIPAADLDRIFEPFVRGSGRPRTAPVSDSPS
jgi:K+-sensing histidine kinase KdpD